MYFIYKLQLLAKLIKAPFEEMTAPSLMTASS